MIEAPPQAQAAATVAPTVKAIALVVAAAMVAAIVLFNSPLPFPGRYHVTVKEIDKGLSVTRIDTWTGRAYLGLVEVQRVSPEGKQALRDGKWLELMPEGRSVYTTAQ